MRKVIITGITGFIGSHIGYELIKQGYKVFALHRHNSSFHKCKAYINNISLINIESDDWEQKVLDIKANIFIHTAWGGITAECRGDWDLQMENFIFSKKIFDLAIKSNAEQIISLGSQAEYGKFDSVVDENSLCMPIEAYGAIKLLTCNYLLNIGDLNKIKVQWIRVFTIFGEGENENMLIPMAIKKLLKSESIDLTECLQQYNYLYIQDFIKYFLYLLQPELFPSGVYNICNTKPESIRSVLIKIAELVNKSTDLLNFGKLPYRDNQNMIITGTPAKFTSIVDLEIDSDIAKGLEKTINRIK